MREMNTKRIPLPEVDYPEFKALPTVLNKWQRFKRDFEMKYRPSLSYALIVNSLLLVAILVFTWVSVAFEGFFNPSTILGLFSLPMLFAIFDAVCLVEQEQEKEVARQKKDNKNQNKN
jgi:hypothetical protein